MKKPTLAPLEDAPGGIPYHDIADVAAMQALARGEATPDQQKRALDWIIILAAQTYRSQYRQNDRDHAFVAGRAFVGQTIVGVLKLNIATLKKRERDSGD